MSMQEIDITDVAAIPRGRGYSGFVYVIEFGNGTVKVGMTENPAGRLANHVISARSLGVTIARAWLSPEHHEYRANERTLINWARERARHVRGTEYFEGVSASQAVEFASTLDFRSLSDEEVRVLQESAATRVRALIPAVAPTPVLDTPQALNAWLLGELRRIATTLGMYAGDNSPIVSDGNEEVEHAMSIVRARGSEPD